MLFSEKHLQKGRRAMDLTIQNTAFGRVAPVETRKLIPTILCRMLKIYIYIYIYIREGNGR